jgi:hypothetical protein
MPARLLTPMDKSETVLFWLLPFLFLPLFSPLSALAIPIAISRLLSPDPNHWGHGGHYSAPLAPLLAMAAGDAFSKISSRIADSVVRTRAGLIIAILCALSSALVPGHQPLLRLFSPGHYRALPDAAEIEQALRSIPAGASVVSQSALAPHLSHRNDLYLLESPFRDADYVVVSTTLDPWPLAGPDASRKSRRSLSGHRLPGDLQVGGLYDSSTIDVIDAEPPRRSECEAARTRSLVAIDRLHRKRRQTDRHVLRTTRIRAAVAHPLSGMRDDGLAGVHVDRSAFVLHAQHAA